jgi:hypothetical protein
MLHAYATGDLFGVRLTTVLDYLIGEDNLFLGDFEVFFFDTNKLKKEKNSEMVKTVRDILILSEGLVAELYYENEYTVEVKLRFQKNKKFENDLNTLYFSKMGDKWYVERLF